MAQVNSSPGQNQVAGNVTVTSATAEVGTDQVKVAARAVTVPYMQVEPGKPINQTNTTRS
jgi:hypothetical protein